MNEQTLISGRVLIWDGAPMTEGPGAARIEPDWAVLIEGGKVAALGPAGALRSTHPQAAETRYGSDLICPGFVDPHVHYPQTRIIASWGKRLIDWLETYTFPEEMRFGDPAYARAVADSYLDLTLAAGTTTVSSYCTSHPASVDAFFEAARRAGTTGVRGQDLHGPKRTRSALRHRSKRFG